MIAGAPFSFEWDEGNQSHCRKHGMRLAEIESVFYGDVRVAPDAKHSTAETRFIAIGDTDEGRMAFVVFTLRGNRIRPLSARYMHAAEVAKYGS